MLLKFVKIYRFLKINQLTLRKLTLNITARFVFDISKVLLIPINISYSPIRVLF